METFFGHHGHQIWQLQIFLWGYLKERVYQTKPSTLQELKDSIRREIFSIQQETLTLVMECVVRRVQHCVAFRGGHLPQVIFRTSFVNNLQHVLFHFLQNLLLLISTDV
jgi:hypothetical protein